MSESQNWGVWSNLFTDLVAFLAFREETLPTLYTPALDFRPQRYN